MRAMFSRIVSAVGGDSTPAHIAHKERGDKALQTSKYEEAAKYFTDALKSLEERKVGSIEDVSDVEIQLLYDRASAYRSMEAFELALQDAIRIIEISPDSAKGYYAKALAHEAIGQLANAKDMIQKASILDGIDSEIQEALQRIEDAVAPKVEEAPVGNNIDSNPDADHFTKMVNWLTDSGAKFPNLYLKYYSHDYRGVHASSDIKDDELVLYIPLNKIMTSDIAIASPIGQKIIRSGLHLNSHHSYLACYLLEERTNPKSYWKPYIDILPKDYKNMPIFFTNDLLAHLKGSFSLQKISDRIESLRREYENICNSIPEFRRHSHDDFVWARLVVITRIFGMVINGDKTDGLVPYADMLNHKIPKETRWTYDDSVKGFTIHATQNITKGAQVYDSYGRKCNHRFFVNYGFSVDNNEEDNEAVLRLELSKEDVHYQFKLQRLGGRSYNAFRSFQIPAVYNDSENKCQEVFSFARFIEARDKELMLFSDSFYKEVSPVSVENEKRAIKRIAEAARSALAEFNTSLEHDIEYLKNPDLDMNMRNIYCMLKGEKTVLHWFANLETEAMPYLDMTWDELKIAIAPRYQRNNTTDYYIINVIAPLVHRASYH